MSRNWTSPSSARYSAWTGTITRSAAASALTVTGPKRRRAVEEREVKALADRAEPLAQAGLGALDPRKLDGGAGQVAARRNEPEVVGTRRAGGLGDRDLADQAVIGGRVRLAVATERDGRVALGVEVDEQRLPAAAAKQAARLTAVVVLPTPPFWFATA